MGKNKQIQSVLPPEMALNKKASRYTSREDWRRELDKMIRMYGTRFDKKTMRERFDLSGPIFKRRSEAMLNSIDDVYKRYNDVLPFLPDENALGREWLWLNLPLKTYTTIESESSLLFGASVWILDHISDFDTRQKLYRLLPTDESVFDDLYWPDVWDCKHDSLLIAGVMYLLQNRHTDISKPEYVSCLDEMKAITDNVNAVGKQETICPSMGCYRKLIALLPQEDIQRADERFRELQWEWSDRFFRCSSLLLGKVTELNQQHDAIAKQYNDVRKKLQLQFESMELELKALQKGEKKAPIGSPLLAAPKKPASIQQPIFPGFSSGIGSKTQLGMRQSESYMHPMLQETQRIESELSRLGEQCEKYARESELAYEQYQRFWYLMLRYGNQSKEYVEKEFGPEFSSEMHPIKIGDPFELCFALLNLLESGDDLPWLYGPGVGLMNEVAESLPWGIYPYEEEDDMVWFPDDDYVPEAVKPSAIPDWYERKYVYSNKYRESDFPRSLAQIVYEETGCLMPRDMHLYDSAAKELGRYGIRGKDAIALQYCMLALSHARHQPHPTHFTDYELDDVEETAAQQAPTEHQTYDQLQEQTERQKKELAALRTALHEAERTAAERQKELERAKQASDMERRELADLRERVFQQGAEEESSEPSEEEESAFPYEVERETVIFGGHATWSKTIRPLLTGNVRFMDKDRSFDAAVIRHADVVWIQPNALSHSMFYGIIDEARRCKKPVRYFAYASAVKCAQQLMQTDQLGLR